MHPLAWDGRIPVRAFGEARVVWTEVPKVASTSLKLAIANAGGAGFEADTGVHDFVGRSLAANLDQLREWLTLRWSGWWRFALVRHPVDRFESLYRQKIDPAGRGSINAWLAAQADSYWWDDLHAVPQARIVGRPEWYDRVYHLEHLAPLVLELRARFGPAFELGHLNRTPGQREPLTAESRRRLERIYAEDLDTFGYSPGLTRPRRRA